MPLLRLLGVHDATSTERRATVWTAAMFFCVMASNGWLRPLRDLFGVAKGNAAQPYLYSLTLLATVLLLPPFWWLANRLPSRRFVPAMLHAFAFGALLLCGGLLAVGKYDWAKAPRVGEVFWGTFSAFNVAAPALVWIHAVEHFRREQALRLFGLLSVGGTLGALAGSGLSALQSQFGAPWWSALGALAMLELAFLCHRASLRACAALPRDDGPPARPARGGTFAALPLLLRSPRLLGIFGYMLFYGTVATAFAFAQNTFVPRVGDEQQQHWFLANQESCSQALVLVLQLFAAGHLQRRFPGWLFLVSLPAISCLGLLAVAQWQTAMTVAAVMVLRRGSSFAFEKPAREVLYTPFDLETKHKVKFLLDTFAFRLGDLFGALFQQMLVGQHASAMAAATATIALALLWAVLGVLLGRRPRAAAVHAPA